MLFNSLVFVVFAVVFYSIWPLVRTRDATRWGFLVVASFVFYGWWDWRFLFLIIASGTIDYFAGIGIERYPRFKKSILWLSISCNIGTLSIFKYSGFFARNLDVALNWIGLSAHTADHLPYFVTIIPIGISFYTFQSMSYTIDIYRGNLSPTRNVFHFFAYLSMFPQLVAGPIVRASDMLAQLKTVRPVSESDRWEGLKLIVYGLFKKMVIADNLAQQVNFVFENPTQSGSCSLWWLTALLFSVQIYCDFSGYTDIARGLGRWMGLHIRKNFDHPYSATSLRDFWQRWHISLSTWFRDYVYFPLGGNRRGSFRRSVNIFVTMLLSGLWHGASWTFLVWGLYHAACYTFERLVRWRQFAWRVPVAGKVVVYIVVQIQILAGWVFFRSTSWEQAVHILSSMFFPWSGTDRSWPMFNEAQQFLFYQAVALSFLVIVREISFLLFSDERRHCLTFDRRVMPLLVGLMIAACIFLRGPGNNFIYFQF